MNPWSILSNPLVYYHRRDCQKKNSNDKPNAVVSHHLEIGDEFDFLIKQKFRVHEQNYFKESILEMFLNMVLHIRNESKKISRISLIIHSTYST